VKAMILAAGLGTRLRPLTNNRPKALVDVGGRTMLEMTLARLREFGVNEVIINVHHFADMFVEYLKKNDNFGMRIEVSRESVLLDTGGGLKKAAWFFLGASSGLNPGSQEPFLVHNVDVISTIDLSRMVEFHRDHQALATLAVQNRETSRYLLFDENSLLCGRRVKSQPDEIVRGARTLQPLAFSGIHVISPRVLTMLTEEGVFSIIEAYLRLAGAGETILAFRADEYGWSDLGTPANVEQARRELRPGASGHAD
jgi:NDP-sugar pyrophosphorylase family protein